MITVNMDTTERINWETFLEYITEYMGSMYSVIVEIDSEDAILEGNNFYVISRPTNNSYCLIDILSGYRWDELTEDIVTQLEKNRESIVGVYVCKTYKEIAKLIVNGAVFRDGGEDEWDWLILGHRDGHYVQVLGGEEKFLYYNKCAQEGKEKSL